MFLPMDYAGHQCVSAVFAVQACDIAIFVRNNYLCLSSNAHFF